MLMILVALPLAAEEGNHSDAQGWIEYQYRTRIRDKLQGSWGLGYRELISGEGQLSDWSRLHLRGFLIYSHSPRLLFEAGLGGYYSFQEPQPDRFELRTWQGAILRRPEIKLAGREFALQHRLRLEQRFVQVSGSGETDFGLRLRYRLAVFVPLNNPSIEAKTFYLPLAGEWFYDIGDETNEFFAAQARVTTGLGYVFGDNWALELRYTAQRSRDTVLDRFTTTDHILDLRIRTTLRFRDLGTPW